jgi:predicted nuclease with TOPRIM domain
MLGLGKKEPMMTEPQPLELSREEQEAIAGLTRTTVERNELRAENARLNATLDEMQRETDFLREQLRIAEHKRDMFQRHAVALYTRMVDAIPQVRLIADNISRALEEARLETTQGGAAPVAPRDLDQIDESLRDVVANLKGDGTEVIP